MTWLCHRFDVTPSGYYAWRARGVSAHAIQDRRLTTEILRLFARHHERYGSPRMQQALVSAGWTVSRRRVARLMAAAGLRAKAVCGYRAKVAIHLRYARHPNLLWQTEVTTINAVWVGDITDFTVAGCWWYLAIVMDQYSRRILAWSLTRRRTSAVTCAVLAEAVRRRPAKGVIFHSDRGTEGGFNRSSQHLQPGGVYGATCRMDEAFDRKGFDALSGGSLASARRRASVLGTDCDGNYQREGGRGNWRGVGGRHALVPASWRHALGDGETCLWPVSVVFGARRDWAAARTSCRYAGDRSPHWSKPLKCLKGAETQRGHSRREA